MEIILVLIVALIVFGPKKLPELGKSLGKGIHEFKGTISGEDRDERPAAVEQHPVVVAPGPAPRAAESETPTETRA
ncbi:MAG: Sec-independent protein translocase subunit TatA/TatB [Solirubrobacterales bacterium]